MSVEKKKENMQEVNYAREILEIRPVNEASRIVGFVTCLQPLVLFMGAHVQHLAQVYPRHCEKWCTGLV